MLEQCELERINELAKLKKTRGLSAEEALEQTELRKKFLDDFRCRFRRQLENIEWVDPEDPSVTNDRLC
jgi:uncharacterized protein YnzC (UPF0291/DUF896 family)